MLATEENRKRRTEEKLKKKPMTCVGNSVILCPALTRPARKTQMTAFKKAIRKISAREDVGVSTID